MKFKITLLLNIIVSIMMISCSNPTISNNKKNTKIQDSLTNQIQDLISSFQYLHEYFSTVKGVNKSYSNKHILQTSLYSNINKQCKETLLGIILADFIYKYSYYEDVSFELKKIKIVSDDLKITNYFNFEISLYKESDIKNDLPENIDSLCFLFVVGVNNYLQEYNYQDKYDKCLKVLFGYWIESLYMQINLMDENNKTLIAREIEVINNFSKLSSQITDNKINDYIKRLELAFSRVNVIEPKNAVPDAGDSPLVILDVWPEYKVTDSDLQNIITEINNIHELVLQDIKGK